METHFKTQKRGEAMTRINARKKMIVEQHANCSYFLHSSINYPLTEDGIITMHQHFLTNGFYRLTVPSWQDGRNLLENFFRSTHYYHDIGCITLEQTLFDHSVSHIYHELLYAGYLDPLCEHDLEQFFLEQFYFDFIWIETSQPLLESSWFNSFQEKLIHFKIDKHIPIIEFSY